MLNIDSDSDETLTMPDVTSVFASAATYREVAAVPTKSAGAGDSVKNQKSSIKAPGGNDASHQKDGG